MRHLTQQFVAQTLESREITASVFERMHRTRI
jgi:hypothetical protein